MSELTDSQDTEGASAKCPLCGVSSPHEHSPLERTIYRNGQKAALSMLNDPVAYIHPATGFVISASEMERHTERRWNQQRDPMYYVPLFEKPRLP
jgi:hypothetical protein